MSKVVKSPVMTLTLAALVVAAVPAFAKKTEWRVASMAAGTKNPVPADAASVAAGKQLWAKQCTSCHGPSGRGDGSEARKLVKSVPDLTDPELLRAQSDGEVFRKISVGRRPMPGYRKTLTDVQRWHLVNYMRTLPRR